MGVILRPDGRKEEISPKNGKFSLYEISELLNGLIEPHFVGDYWVFINKTAFRKGLPYNEAATALFNYPISGSCMIIKEVELPAQFFLTNNTPPKDNTEKNKEDKERELQEFFDKTYDLIFKKKRTNVQITKKFIILNGNDVLDITKDTTKQFIVLDKLMEYYMGKEEYERCAAIKSLLNHIRKNY